MLHFCDVVPISLYVGAHPAASLIEDIHKWGGKPVYVTEFYAKGMGNHQRGV